MNDKSGADRQFWRAVGRFLNAATAWNDREDVVARMNRALLALAIVVTPCASSGSNPPVFDSSWPPSTPDNRGTAVALRSSGTNDALLASAPTTSVPVVGVDIALPYQAGSVAASAGSIWVIPHFNEVVLRVDPTTNRVVEEIALPGVVGAEIDANADTVWMSVSTPGTFAPAGVMRLDAATGDITGPFTIDGVDAVFPKVGPDGVWVAGDGRDARLDAATGDVLEVIETPGGTNGAHIATTQGLWIAHPDGIWNVESASGVFDEIGRGVADLPLGEFGLPFVPVAEYDGQVWGIGADNVVAIDLNSHEISRTVDLPEGITPCPDGAISESVLWLISGSSGTCWGSGSALLGIDTATGNVSYHEPLPFASEYGMDVTADAVWVPVVRQPRIVRIPIEE